MIRYLYADQLAKQPVLANSMFRDRATQFKHRLDWEVSVDDSGREVDQYDALNPLYVVWQNPDGSHGGSLRVLPTVGRTMTAEHFLHLTDGVRVASPLIWECTRFCLSPTASADVAPALMLAGIELGLRFGLDQAVGVVYARTLPLYRRFGWSPDVVGAAGEGRERICVGLWPMNEAARREISCKSGLPVSVMARWFDLSFQGAAAAEQESSLAA
jgi:N-acyl-L-homoserine lactone synthetase